MIHDSTKWTGDLWKRRGRMRNALWEAAVWSAGLSIAVAVLGALAFVLSTLSWASPQI